MPRPLVDMNGPIRDTRLTVTNTYREGKRTRCDCECDCYGTGEFTFEDGRPVFDKKRVTFYAHNLKSGATTSCGCARYEKDESPLVKEKMEERRRNRRNRYGHLFVWGYDRKSGRYVVTCNCGLHPSTQFLFVTGQALVTNRRIGCDLFHKRQAQLRKDHPREAQSYDDMRRRTSNERDARYGGRGVRVADQWLPYSPGCGLVRFLKDMGPRPDGKTLHKVDNDKGYSQKNCEWADAQVQSEHRKGVTRVTFLAEEMSFTRFCRVIREIDPRGSERASKRMVREQMFWGLPADYIATFAAWRHYDVELFPEVVVQLYGECGIPIDFLHSVHPSSALAATRV